MNEPVTIYKYMNKKFAKSFLDKGVLRIGTLYDFRNSEHGEEIGDSEEGQKTVFLDGPIIVDSAVPESVPYFLAQRMNIEEPIRLQLIAKGGVAGMVEDADCFIFSCSYEYNLETMKAMGYDCCLEINNPNSFFAAITSKLRMRAKFLGWGLCQYRDRKIHLSQDEWPASLIKDPMYEHQKEVRACWGVRKGCKVNPLNIRVPKASNYCRIIGSV